LGEIYFNSVGSDKKVGNKKEAVGKTMNPKN
jgi:hypothetical protein